MLLFVKWNQNEIACLLFHGFSTLWKVSESPTVGVAAIGAHLLIGTAFRWVGKPRKKGSDFDAVVMLWKLRTIFFFWLKIMTFLARDLIWSDLI
jgi:hypothetical protein